MLLSSEYLVSQSSTQWQKVTQAIFTEPHGHQATQVTPEGIEWQSERQQKNTADQNSITRDLKTKLFLEL